MSLDSSRTDVRDESEAVPDSVVQREHYQHPISTNVKQTVCKSTEKSDILGIGFFIVEGLE